MKKKNLLKKLTLNKNDIARLDFQRLFGVRGGTDTFTEPQWMTCDLPACLTQQYNTCGCPNTATCPPVTGKPYCQLCPETDPLSC